MGSMSRRIKRNIAEQVTGKRLSSNQIRENLKKAVRLRELRAQRAESLRKYEEEQQATS